MKESELKNMKILAVDSSAISAGCAIVDGGDVIAESFVRVGLTHSETLLPMVANTLANAKLTAEDIDCFAVSSGPGSFTGIRIGVAAVKGMAFSRNTPCIGVSTLEAIAWNGMALDGVICAAMDARRQQVYNALFTFDGEGMMETEAAHKKHFAALHQRLIGEYPGLLALSAGTCRRCARCTYPDAPCRFPDACFSSMEAYGILVLDACKANGLQYYYGPNAIAYTSCFLLA